ncbi:error-prone DNA polymerase [Marinomonas mediterranea]|uniref:error-prone DNA polymerase n=1 Tax=Marinomonas mediterranea TaxID=119864 RepID=UPI00234B13C3|nr:error-prone DNA polymerase [Marinomonas mediterranea]WCN09394.1 DNA polymerase III subunit alpha [Marinomonas mediterranea]
MKHQGINHQPENRQTVTHQATALRYAELHVISSYTFQQGASHPWELVEHAQKLNYSGIAITDECSLAGVVKAHEASKEHGIPLIIGSTFQVKGFSLIVLAPSIEAYRKLSMLITKGRRNAEKGHYHLQLEDYLSELQGCLFIIVITDNTLEQSFSSITSNIKKISDCYPNNVWLGLQQLLTPTDRAKKQTVYRLSSMLRLPVTAVSSVDMHEPSRQPLRDVMTAIRLHASVNKLNGRQAPNAETHLRSPKKLRKLYSDQELEESLTILERCHFSLDELKYDYPKDLVPEGTTPSGYLKQLTYEGLHRRYSDCVPQAIEKQIEKELSIIKELKFEHYFLTVWDIVKFARKRNILCQGRGSAANSAVCYCLGITEVNPANTDLLFERFISKERHEPPDIDVDFEHERREEVIQYLYQRYGRERAALAATVITYRAKSAIRDVGKALGYEEHFLSKLIKQLDRRDKATPWLKQLSDYGNAKPSYQFQLFLKLVEEILGFPRHLSQHVGGFVIAAERVDHLVPVENASMEGRTIIQWDKDDLESLGLLKVDVLALGMLTAIKKSLNLISKIKGAPFTLQSIPREDHKVYDMLQKGESIGVFQIESRAQINMLPRLKPNCFYDLVIQVAIVRPGPIQGGMVHPYLQRRAGTQAINYPSAEVKSVLNRTLGVPIFQEQVIKLAMVAAGFSAGEADQLRRAMAAWKRTGRLKPFQDKLKQGMLERGYDEVFADQLCMQIQGFGEYGFPESHAASFAILVYFSSWLKHYYPTVFCCSLLNSQPMGFYTPYQLIQDAQRNGVIVKPVCVQHSEWDHTLERLSESEQQNQQDKQFAIRLGFRLVKGMSHEGSVRLTQKRGNTPFTSLEEFLNRVKPNKRDKEALASSGAFSVLSGNRFQARWDILGHQQETELNLELNNETKIALPTPSEQIDTLEDLKSMGVSLGKHPMRFLREQGACYKCTPSNELEQGTHQQLIRVSGLVTGRQRPGTASGVTFITLEDEFGNTNVVVWQATASAQKKAFLGATILEVHGVLEKEGKVVHVIAGRLIDRTHLWETLSIKSRNFH